jgi:hypothetical protein
LSRYAVRNSAKFRGVLGNSARNTEETEVQKTYGISCRRNSVDTLLLLLLSLSASSGTFNYSPPLGLHPHLLPSDRLPSDYSSYWSLSPPLPARDFKIFSKTRHLSTFPVTKLCLFFVPCIDVKQISVCIMLDKTGGIITNSNVHFCLFVIFSNIIFLTEV